MLFEIPWDLNDGPNEIARVLNGYSRPDLIYPFAYICYLFRNEKTPLEIVTFLHIFDGKHKVYNKFFKIFNYLSIIEQSISSIRVRALLYLISLNILFEWKQPFQYIHNYFKEDNEYITEENLNKIEKEYNKKYSLSSKYQWAFNNLINEDKRNCLLNKIKIYEDRLARGNLITRDMTSLAKELYRYHRCALAHGRDIIPLTIESESNGIIYSYKDNGERKVIATSLINSDWESIIRYMILKFFEDSYALIDSKDPHEH